MHHIYFKKLTYFLFWVIGGSDFRFHLMFWFMCLYQHEHLLLMEQLRLLFFLAVSQLCILSVSSRGSETFNNLSSCLGATMAALLLSKSTKTNPIVKFLYIRISRVFFFCIEPQLFYAVMQSDLKMQSYWCIYTYGYTYTHTRRHAHEIHSPLPLSACNLTIWYNLITSSFKVLSCFTSIVKDGFKGSEK